MCLTAESAKIFGNCSRLFSYSPNEIRFIAGESDYDGGGHCHSKIGVFTVGIDHCHFNLASSR